MCILQPLWFFYIRRPLLGEKSLSCFKLSSSSSSSGGHSISPVRLTWSWAKLMLKLPNVNWYIGTYVASNWFFSYALAELEQFQLSGEAISCWDDCSRSTELGRSIIVGMFLCDLCKKYLGLSTYLDSYFWVSCSYCFEMFNWQYLHYSGRQTERHAGP